MELLFRSNIKTGILASYVNTAIGIICNFIIIPVYIKYLGREDYGLWITISGLVTYLGFLNFGIAQSTANIFGNAVMKQNVLEQKKILSTGFWFYFKLIGLALVVLLAVDPWLPVHILIKGSDSAKESSKYVLLVSAICFLIELPFSLFSTCLRNIGKIHLQQFMAAIQNIARLLVAFIYLYLSSNLIGLIVALACTNVIVHLLNYTVLKHELPAISFHPIFYDNKMLNDMIAPSFYFLVLQISGAIAFSTDSLVISAMLGTELVTPYAVAQRLAYMAMGVVTVISVNFGPLFLMAYSQHNIEELRLLFKRAMLISLSVGTLVFVCLLIIGPFLISFWVGEINYVGLFPYLMIIVLMLIQMVLYPADILLTITNNHKVYSLVALWEALLNLGLSIYLAPVLGVGGVALGTIIARCLGAGPVMLWQSSRVLKHRNA
jgi:O-antigen/teichoic acid export membrane protein